jgi:hypothetical protein
MSSINLRIFFLVVVILVLTQTLRNEVIFKALMNHELKKHELKKSIIYKEQLLKLNEKNSIQNIEKKENKDIVYPKDIVNQKEIIPIIDGTHVNRLPRFWQTDRPWTVGFSGGKCVSSDFLVLINSAPKNLNFRQVQRQYLMRQTRRFKMEYKFLLGEMSETLESENEKYGDLVFGDHTDSYVIKIFVFK